MIRTQEELAEAAKSKIRGDRPNPDTASSENLRAATLLQLEVLVQIRDIQLLLLQHLAPEVYTSYLQHGPRDIHETLEAVKLLAETKV
jgi:hypothetical protein